MTDSITITLPLPARELSPNWRGHWAAKSKRVKAYREHACAMALRPERAWMPAKKATSQLTFYWPDKRRRDKDNSLASMKSVFDGIADAGVVADDSGITHLPTTFAVDKANPRVEVTITVQEQQA